MRVCLAGTGCITEKNRKEVYDVPFILESFYSIKEWQIPLIKKCDLFLLDSGAFTFLNSTKKGNKVSAKDFDKYLDKYIDFINKNDVKYFFELDIDSVVGIEEVERLRKRLENETGKKSIPVWHFSRGKDYFIKMCKEYDYVAFGGIITDGVSTKEILKYLPWFVKTAHKYNCKIHALGLTCKDLEKYGLDSADSTTWKAANRFGNISIFKEGKMVQIHRPEGKRLKSGEMYSVVELHQLKEWIKYQKYLENK